MSSAFFDVSTAFEFDFVFALAFTFVLACLRLSLSR